MPNPIQRAAASPRLRRRLVLAGLLAAAVWVGFFDSHSLAERVRGHAAHRDLAAQNAQLQAEIDALQQRLDAGLSDEVVEQVAREQYGMRRPGETVYPAEEFTR